MRKGAFESIVTLSPTAQFSHHKVAWHAKKPMTRRISEGRIKTICPSLKRRVTKKRNFKTYGAGYQENANFNTPVEFRYCQIDGGLRMWNRTAIKPIR